MHAIHILSKSFAIVHRTIRCQSDITSDTDRRVGVDRTAKLTSLARRASPRRRSRATQAKTAKTRTISPLLLLRRIIIRHGETRRSDRFQTHCRTSFCCFEAHDGNLCARPRAVRLTPLIYLTSFNLRPILCANTRKTFRSRVPEA